MRRHRLAVAAIIMMGGVQSAEAAPRATQSAAPCRAHAPEAAVRSGLTVEVIMRVMRAESGGSARVVSPKGAIGCMQIIPATWAYLSRRYGLGDDPYDARLNMIGGALYLAELARQFGWPGAYAAYNAGPARYIRYAVNGVPLPAETVAYVARLGGAAAPASAPISHARWQEARLFLDRIGGARDAADTDALRVAATPETAGVLSASTTPSPSARIAPTLFPLSANVTQVQR